jgi:hypothetical protein
MTKIKLAKYKVLLLVPLLLALNLAFFIQPTSAAALTNTYIRLNRIAAAQTTSFRLVFKTVGSGATC